MAIASHRNHIAPFFS